MALRKNPITGELEEDGLPGLDDPLAMPAVPTAFDVGQGGMHHGTAPPPLPKSGVQAVPVQAPASGPAAGGGTTINLPANTPLIGGSSRPVQETETTRRLKSAETAVAEGALLNAEEASTDASRAAGEVEAREADVRQDYADRRAAEKARQADEARVAEEARQRVVQDHLAADRTSIEEEKKARIEAGKADQSYWEGRPGAQFFSKVLQVIGGVAHDVSGQGGVSPADKALTDNIEGHRRRLVSTWEATKEANHLKRTNRQAWEAELERRNIAANNQSLLSLDLIEEQMGAALAGLSKDKQAAARQVTEASLNEKRKGVWLSNQESYNKIQKLTSNTFRDQPGGTPARPLSTEAKDIVAAAAEMKRLATRQKELIRKNNGYPSLGTPDRREFENNDAAMATILQKPLGKSDSDAKKAEELQGAPGFWAKALNTKGSVERYETALHVNARRIEKDAQTRAALEGYGSGPGADPVDESWKGQTKTISSGTYERTGPGPNDWRKVKVK